MTFSIGLCLTLVASLLTALAQPVMTNGVIAKLDFDGDESQDIEYQVSANKTRDQPKQWVVDSAWCLCEEAECFVVRLNNLDLSKEMLSTVRALYFVK